MQNLSIINETVVSFFLLQMQIFKFSHSLKMSFIMALKISYISIVFLYILRIMRYLQIKNLYIVRIALQMLNLWISKIITFIKIIMLYSVYNTVFVLLFFRFNGYNTNFTTSQIVSIRDIILSWNNSGQFNVQYSFISLLVLLCYQDKSNCYSD